MCLVIVAFQCCSELPLVVAANRDEYYARGTEPAAFWLDQPQLLAGRDLVQGGTWMGLTRQGRFAAITNYRDPARTEPAPRSRGELPLAFLGGSQGCADFLHSIAGKAAEYAGFNLLVGVPGELWYLSNGSVARLRPRRLASGIYGLSNASLDTPWPKVQLGKRRLRELLARTETPTHDELLAVVGDRKLANSSDLAQLGLGEPMDQLLSAQFITAPRYGTRSSTSVWLDASRRAHWCELSFDQRGEVVSSVEQQFVLDEPSGAPR